MKNNINELNFPYGGCDNGLVINFIIDNSSLSKIFLMTHLFCLADAESKIYFSPHKHATHYA